LALRGCGDSGRGLQGQTDLVEPCTNHEPTRKNRRSSQESPVRDSFLPVQAFLYRLQSELL
jgi:hypothetical protein